MTSNSGAMSEIAQGAAVLVDPCNINSIAAGIVRVILDDNARRPMVAKGLERAKEFSQQRRARRYLDVLEEAANGLGHFDGPI